MPRRSRKLLPRLLTAALAEISELMIVMPGVGVGDGAGNIWACAEHTAATVRATPIAKARASLRPAPPPPPVGT